MRDDESDERGVARPQWIKIAREALLRTLRFIAAHVRGFWTALAAFVTIGFLAGLAAAWAFAVLGRIVLGGATQSVDEAVLRWVATLRTPLLDQVALDITSLGNIAVLIVVVAVASVFLFMSRHRYSAYLLWIAVAGEELISTLLKDAYGRARPSVVPLETAVMTASFPSGHAMASIVAYGAIALLVGRLAESRSMRRTTWAVAALAIALVGSSRIYLGVHYPSDVIGGFIAGFAWLAVLASSLSALKFFAPRKPGIEEQEKDLEKGEV